ncbi:2Fe-2S ferredoxin [Clostridium estertheticum]|uniref:2Fe-2S ferredoxin n=1 Tax=Clostridium estertheticum subsp. estertheticum TaxID=1552 RepID=A0A1J0GFN8_9CLOT|nr:2Fe-2S ferredoxin [Clostridium estertheticum]APC39702.1 2Fe-2S ferredoxin [Clostridium estertheticum subsp. estertheticum]MBU3173417.1 (2Fe-2S) ferredoxin domain-containing protein [Clostridium estertheticum]MBZ9614258.1 (2Fe-2S) ferredoxin domain-containing protein [Clostridium estertheticum subsp. laramiense]WAG74198.1 (2Fe-2S) ferredoxin domain-containing protein [Clostridium estertheticum]
MIKPEFHVFVCTSSRINGTQKGYCHSNDSTEIVTNFIEAIEENDISDKVMVTNSGCLGLCNEGQIVIVYPEGTWYGKVTPDDVDEIVQSHLINGDIVKRLEI